MTHTAFLHRGLFRGGKKNQIRALVRRSPDRDETENLGEPAPGGIAALEQAWIIIEQRLYLCEITGCRSVMNRRVVASRAWRDTSSPVTKCLEQKSDVFMPSISRELDEVFA